MGGFTHRLSKQLIKKETVASMPPFNKALTPLEIIEHSQQKRPQIFICGRLGQTISIIVLTVSLKFNPSSP
jgi:hypothetical protein